MAIKHCKECGRSIGTFFDDPDPREEYCQKKCKQKSFCRRMKELKVVKGEQRRYGYLKQARPNTFQNS